MRGTGRHWAWSPLHVGPAVDHNDPDCCYVSADPSTRLAHNGAGTAGAYIYRWRGAGPWQLALSFHIKELRQMNFNFGQMDKLIN